MGIGSQYPFGYPIYLGSHILILKQWSIVYVSFTAYQYHQQSYRSDYTVVAVFLYPFASFLITIQAANFTS